MEEAADQSVERAKQMAYDNVANLSMVVADVNSGVGGLAGEQRYLYDRPYGPACGSATALEQPTTQSNVYDAFGNKISQTDANGRTTRYSHDVIGRTIKTTYADGKASLVSYDDPQRRQSLQDTNGVVTDLYHDELNRLIRVVRRPATDNTVETHYTYDQAGNLLQAKHDGQDTYYSYGIHNKPTQIIYHSACHVPGVGVGPGVIKSLAGCIGRCPQVLGRVLPGRLRVIISRRSLVESRFPP